jgi:hypothetical protein
MQCFPEGAGLFPDAKVTEDGIQKVFSSGLASNFTNCLNCDSQVHGRKFQGKAFFQSLDCSGDGCQTSVQGFLMSGVYHNLQRFSIYFAAPNKLFD